MGHKEFGEQPSHSLLRWSLLTWLFSRDEIKECDNTLIHGHLLGSPWLTVDYSRYVQIFRPALFYFALSLSMKRSD